MNRRASVTCVGAVLATPVAAEGQQRTPRLYRIGWVFLASPGQEPDMVGAFREGLRQHGYVEGRNLVFEFRWAGEGRTVDSLTAELVGLAVDMIVAGTSQNAHAAQRATTTIPILLVGADPLSTGLVTNLARPGANITGITSLSGPAVAAKYVEFVKAAVSSIRRVAILWNEDSKMQPLMLGQAQSAAKALGLKAQGVGFRSPDDFEPAFARMVMDGTPGLVVLPDALTFIHRRRLAELALAKRVPTLFAHSESALAGGLMGYGANLGAIARHATGHVDKIFRGAHPGDLPVEQPTKFDLVINLKTAKALGLTIPPSLLARADQLIE